MQVRRDKYHGSLARLRLSRQDLEERFRRQVADGVDGVVVDHLDEQIGIEMFHLRVMTEHGTMVVEDVGGAPVRGDTQGAGVGPLREGARGVEAGPWIAPWHRLARDPEGPYRILGLGHLLVAVVAIRCC